MAARREESMLPPEMTQQMVPPPAFPASAAASGSAPAPSATMCIRSTSIRIASAAWSRLTNAEPSISDLSIGHISGSRLADPAPSTKLGV
jgi:hypothetical protein